MHFTKYGNKNLHILLRLALGLLLFFNCVGASSCQTKQEKYDAQLKECVLQGQKEVESGTQCLENLHRLNPDEGYVNLFLAENYGELKQLDKAEKTINTFISLYPEEGSGYDVRCQILSDKRDFPAAIKDCLTAIRLKPDDFSYQRHYASVVAVSGDPSAAADLYGYILLKKPGDAPTLVALGRLYERTNQIDEAIETYEKLLKLDDFDLKDKVREGIEKLKLRKDKDSTEKKNKTPGKQGRAIRKPFGN